MTRVLVCTQGFPRHHDDHMATFVLAHARALADSGAHVTVLCPSGPGLARTERVGNVEVVRFRYAPRRLEQLAYTGAMHHAARGWRVLLVPAFFGGFLVEAIRLARRHDVVLGHWWLPSGLVAVLAARLVGVGSAVHVHGTDALLGRGPLRLLARWVFRGAGSVLAVSTHLAAWVQEVSGVVASVAPMPLVHPLAPTPVPESGAVLAVGRLVPEKGFDVLVRAAPRAGASVVLIGDGPERERLQRLASAEGADVTFVGSVPSSALASYYLAARLVVVPSRREGLGLVAAEAAAAGRAVIASRVGGLLDVVRDGLNGTLVPAGDVDALAAALRSTHPALGAAGPAVVAHLQPARVGGRDLALLTAAAASSRPALAPRLARVAASLLAAVAVVLCGLAVVQGWDDASSAGLQWRPGWFASAAAAVVGADLLMAWAWADLLGGLGAALPWRAGMRIWWAGQLGRYLPTGLGSAPARVVLAVRAGVARRPAVTATAAEPAAAVAVCATFAAVLLPFPVAALGVVGAALATWSVARAALGRAGLRFAALQVVQVAMRVLGFWSVLHLTGATRVPGLVDTAGAMGLAYALGFLAVFAPGGVGVREAVLAAVLGPTAGTAAVVAAAVGWRLVEVVADAALLGWSRTLRVKEPAKGSISP